MLENFVYKIRKLKVKLRHSNNCYTHTSLVIRIIINVTPYLSLITIKKYNKTMQKYLTKQKDNFQENLIFTLIKKILLYLWVVFHQKTWPNEKCKYLFQQQKLKSCVFHYCMFFHFLCNI